ncbi:MAG TPA: CocE/NonD family hydrolase [Actinomycetota bacterium]|nr:CocE/NonD family hydrolase [Actinomycetota bacterium]
MRRPLIAVLLGAALLAPSVGAPSGAQEVDPLIADSLAALTGLVDKDDCKVKDALDGDAANGTALPFVFCDDGLPPAGGGELAIPVPVKYRATEGDDFTGLPKPASADEATAADEADDLRPESGNRISLDVDITLPPTVATNELLAADLPIVRAPKGGYPVIVFMHGCCGGNKTSWEAESVDAANELWHHSNAWFASRGYVVVNYTARGFRNGEDRGSTGTTQLDSRRYEINDYQYLVGLLADHDAARRAAGERPLFRINPRKVAAVGGSYGGGFSWLALTDPTWTSPASDIPLRLGSVVTKYGWTDLVEALVPAGHYHDRDPKTGETFIAPTDPAKALSRDPIGVEKQSIVSGLFASGNLVTGNHTTFPNWLSEAYNRLQLGEPYDGDPILTPLLETFLRDRSAYFQEQYWTRVANGSRVPIYAAATWTDPLFPTMETVRFYNKLRSVAPTYPITMYLGDYQHFTQNKPKEWGDICGSDHHVCQVKDFTRPDGSITLMNSPERVRRGVNFRMARFLDFHLRGLGKRPKSNVSATTTICPANATDKYKADEPGAEYRAPTWRALAPDTKIIGWGPGGTTSTAAVDGHAQESDPVTRDRTAEKCFSTEQTQPGAGVLVYEDNIPETFTMMGVPTLTVEHQAMGAGNYWIGARLLDRDPADGDLTMVTRGVCRVDTDVAPDRLCQTFDLFGNAWTFEKGHKIVIEVTQADVPFLRKANFPTALTYNSANIKIPVAPDSLRVDFRD